MMTHPELSLDDLRNRNSVCVQHAAEVVPREGWLMSPFVGDLTRVVLLNQEALDATRMAEFSRTHNLKPARVMEKFDFQHVI
jgi:hypothetical protein